MDHPADSKTPTRTALPALVAALLACLALLVAVPPALAEPAIDEYKLGYPRGDRASLADLDSTQTLRDRGRPIGIIAEEEGSKGPLEATGAMLTSTPLLSIALVLVLVAAVVSTRIRGART